MDNFRILTPILFQVDTMIELGNKRTKNTVWKHEFEKMGISHVSIDWNGKDGALPLDLTKKIDLPSADVVTNFGTSEHVLDQEMCFENIHNLSKKWIVHQVPYVGNWENHGLKQYNFKCFKYDEEFFEDLALKYNYEIEDMFVDGLNKRKLINVRFRHAHA